MLTPLRNKKGRSKFSLTETNLSSEVRKEGRRVKKYLEKWGETSVKRKIMPCFYLCITMVLGPAMQDPLISVNTF